MSIRKVIKFYFVFVMSIVSMAALSYNTDLREYVVSVLDFDLSTEGLAKTATNLSKELVTFEDSEIEDFFYSETNNLERINFSIENNPENAYAAPGNMDVEIMQYQIETYEKELFIKDLKLKVVGVAPENILGVRLLVKGEEISQGQAVEEYFEFKNVNFRLGENDNVNISLVIDISGEVMTGQRIRFDIEKPEDLAIIVGKDSYTITDYYPIRGKYLSIVRPRPLSKD